MAPRTSKTVYLHQFCTVFDVLGLVWMVAGMRIGTRTRTRCRRGEICRSESDADRLSKTIATLAWLFHVQSSVPKEPIEAFEKHVITAVNYTGESREFLKKRTNRIHIAQPPQSLMPRDSSNKHRSPSISHSGSFPDDANPTGGGGGNNCLSYYFSQNQGTHTRTHPSFNRPPQSGRGRQHDASQHLLGFRARWYVRWWWRGERARAGSSAGTGASGEGGMVMSISSGGAKRKVDEDDCLLPIGSWLAANLR
ncbi:hypothetical protein BDZ97DRAFT_1761925 [Flammula alnicola]|nr:hypothetical protein BDZ97DRAFT_1761925 [Flammula alnicola]